MSRRIPILAMLVLLISVATGACSSRDSSSSETTCGADLETDPENCGVCGLVCAERQACQSAACIDDDARLQSLEVSWGTLTPRFDPDVFEYDLSVAQGTDRLDFRLVPFDFFSQMRVAGQPVVRRKPHTESISPDQTLEVVVQVTADSGREENYRLRVVPTANFPVGFPDYVVPADDAGIGKAVALSDTRLVAGAPFQERVFVYERHADTMALMHTIVTPGEEGDAFGAAVALDGDFLAVGAPEASAGGASDAGKVYVFRFQGDEWALEAELLPEGPNDYANFGAAVALEGDFLAVGAPKEDRLTDESVSPAASGGVYVWQRSEDGTWSPVFHFQPEQNYKNCGADLDMAGGVLVAANYGNPLVFQLREGAWELAAAIEYPHALADPQLHFGRRVATDGVRVAVPGHEARQMFPDWDDVLHDEYRYVDIISVYEWDGIELVLAEQVPVGGATGTDQDTGVVLDGDILAVARPGDHSRANCLDGDDLDFTKYPSGSVHVLHRGDDGFSQVAYVKPNRGADYTSGYAGSLALTGDWLAVGHSGAETNHQDPFVMQTSDDPRGGAVFLYPLGAP